jgi:hypothetical protein
MEPMQLCLEAAEAEAVMPKIKHRRDPAEVEVLELSSLKYWDDS